MKRAVRRRDILTSEEVKRMIAVCRQTCATKIRHRAMISTMWRCQLRVSELITIRTFDIDLKRGCIHVAFGKGDRERMVAIPHAAMAPIRSWEIWRRNYKGIADAESDWFFCRMDGCLMTRHNVNKILQNVCKKAGVNPAKATPHAFRRSGASHLVDCNVDLFMIQSQLGHANIETTYLYCSKVNPKGLIKNIQSKATF